MLPVFALLIATAFDELLELLVGDLILINEVIFQGDRVRPYIGTCQLQPRLHAGDSNHSWRRIARFVEDKIEWRLKAGSCIVGTRGGECGYFDGLKSLLRNPPA